MAAVPVEKARYAVMIISIPVDMPAATNQPSINMDHIGQ